MSRAIGNDAENTAANYLEKEGFSIVARNVTMRGGELDIIALKEGTLHFVEVKSGRGFEAVYNLTPAKLRRVITTACRYMHREKLDLPYSIDAIIIQNGEIEHLKNVTL